MTLSRRSGLPFDVAAVDTLIPMWWNDHDLRESALMLSAPLRPSQTVGGTSVRTSTSPFLRAWASTSSFAYSTNTTFAAIAGGPQNVALRSSVRLSFFFQAVRVNGPLPTGVAFANDVISLAVLAAQMCCGRIG